MLAAISLIKDTVANILNIAVIQNRLYGSVETVKTDKKP